MIARFVLGRAGTGKTYQCLNEIRQVVLKEPDGPPLIFLVPEQATYQMDRALLAGLPGGASTRAQVMSFRRLTLQLLREMGGLDQRLIDDLGRQMLVRALLRRRRNELRLYRGDSIKPGLVSHLSHMLRELRQYCIVPEQLQQWLDALNNSGESDALLALKLQDIHLLYQDYLAKCGQDVFDTDDLPRLLIKAIQNSAWMTECMLWVDSFSDFTAQENLIIKAMLRRVTQATFSLAIDPKHLPVADESDPTRLFARAEITYGRLRDMLTEDTQVEVIGLPDKVPPPRFRNPELAHLEAALFPKAQPFAGGVPQSIRLIEAGSRRAEVDASALEILRLVREHNYHYRDIAVIVRDLARYHDLFEASFEDYGIPFFIDQRRSMAHHPLVELIRCAVRAVTDGWRYEHVVPYLRTGLTPVNVDVVDMLDNHAVEHGIQGEAWYSSEDWRFRRPAENDKEFTQAKKESIQLNADRHIAVEALKKFDERVRASQDEQGKVIVREVAEKVFQLLDELKVDQTLERWRREAETEKHLDLAAESVQVWDAVMDLLDELVSALDDEKFSLMEFAEIIEAGLASLSLALVPPAVDEVLIGSIERSRQPEIRAIFLLGVNEGLFPLVTDEDPILNDDDRSQSTGRRIDLGPTSEERFYQETYLGYIAFTRASERLWVSFPIADDQGRQLNPSPFIDRLRLGFPELKPVRIGTGHGPRPFEEVVTASDLAGGLAYRLRQPAQTSEWQRWLALYNRTREVKDVAKSLEKVLPALTYANRAKLEVVSAKSLFGDTLACTVSRLESFAACPFQHFVQYGLGLQPRREFRLDAMDLGNLYHGALKFFFDHTQDKPWTSLSVDEAERLISEGIALHAASLKNQILLTTARNRYIGDQARRKLALFVRALLEQAKHTEFRPVAAEVSFGLKADAMPPVELPLPGGRRLALHGRIDRIDVAEIAGETYLRTVDYKTGGKVLRLDDVYNGLALQLLVYLLAATRENAATDVQLKTPIAAAAFYSRLLREPTSIDHLSGAITPDSAEFFRAYQLRGVFRSDLVHALDTTPELSNWSNYYKMYLKKDGTLGYGSSSDDVNPAALIQLLELVKRHLVRLGTEILDGQIEVAPVENHGQTPCSYCDFRAVCRLEVPFNHSRVMETMKKDEMLARLQQSTDSGPVELRLADSGAEALPPARREKR
jgi:ATP-dependent helicase/nuclease subunit B